MLQSCGRELVKHRSRFQHFPPEVKILGQHTEGFPRGNTKHSPTTGDKS